ncbi:MAG: type II toxin-antitoxin system RelE/ParE family toxin [Muribaculaceae bacterium]|nr:type II toxin-antitoxin system RelE/ParE family toxin [Muribaculaceae bacterium]
MKITFEKDYLRDLYEKGRCSGKKHRFQPHIISRYQLRIKTLENARKIEDLYPLKSLNYEVLKGDKNGLSSIRVNDQYRIEFTVTQVESENILTICNILELTNHYK